MSAFISPLQLGVGFILAVGVSLAAYRARSLDRSGAAAAVLLGTVFFGLGGWRWAVLLLAFFITSSGLSKLFGKAKLGLVEKFSKGSQRDAGQVFANGGLAGVFVLLGIFFPSQIWPWLGCAGALAAVNADTWATELGVLSRSAPRLISSLQPVERGTSGGISSAGTAAAFGGAALIGLCASLLWSGGADGIGQVLLRLLVVTLAGVSGSFLDSFLGATVQAIYYCPSCRKETERHPLHLCGTPTTLQRGLAWLDNDWVNTACSLGGMIIALLAAWLLPGL